MKMTKKLFVFLLVYTMAFYPLLGSLANAGSSKSEIMSQGSGVEKQTAVDESTKVRLQENYGKLPLSFIQNNGQVDEKVKFYEKGDGRATFFTKEGIYLSLVKSQKPEVRKESSTDLPSVIASDQRERGNLKDKIASSESILNDKARLLANAQNDKSEGVSNGNPQSEIVKLIPLNANKNPEIIAEGKQEGKTNYFIGNDPKKWKTNIPTYNAVVYKEIYKNIDMKFYGNNRQLEYDIIVKPGADPEMVELSYEGIEGLSVSEKGDLEIVTKQGKLVQKKPYIYQDINGNKVEVNGKFKVFNSTLTTDHSPLYSYGFQVASYNKIHPLIIDPVLVYSTYLGGSGGDNGWGIAVDSSGNAYVTGETSSTNFPTASPIQGTKGGAYDAFVTKINASGTALVYSTYLGGSGGDSGSGIAVDSSGNAYITGYTTSTDFPTASPIDGTIGGNFDAFVTKINATGNVLIYSTYLGGSGGERGLAIAVDTAGNTYITGFTSSIDFPTASPINGVYSGYNDAFVTKINASGTNLVYSTYLGGSGDDYGFDIAVDASGNTYITGYTTSTDFPTASPIQGTNAGSGDVFATKINASGTSFVYSTYLGGSGYDVGEGTVTDTSGNMYITGYTCSSDFPINVPIDGTLGECYDIFVTKINTNGSNFVYSTYLGGSGNDQGYSIDVDAAENVYLTGVGPGHVFVTKINASGTNLVYSTYLGGSSSDVGYGIAVDNSGNAYITGYTTSTDFPTASPIQGTNAGNGDVFVTKIGTGVSGCIQLNGAPLVNVLVTLKQRKETDQTTITDTKGCYKFESIVFGKSFQIIIDGPVVP